MHPRSQGVAAFVASDHRARGKAPGGVRPLFRGYIISNANNEMGMGVAAAAGPTRLVPMASGTSSAVAVRCRRDEGFPKAVAYRTATMRLPEGTAAAAAAADQPAEVSSSAIHYI